MGNLYKDSNLVFKRVVDKIIVWDGTLPAAWKDMGYLEKATLEMKAPKHVIGLIDNSDFQTGYDAEFKVTSHQFYSLYQFEKLLNKVCIFQVIAGEQVFYIKNMNVNIEVDAQPGSDKGPIMISGKKFVQNIRDFIDGNPWGSLPNYWAPNSGGIPVKAPSYQPGAGDPAYSYYYDITLGDPLLTFVDPTVAELEEVPTLLIKRLYLTMVDNNHKPIESDPTNISLKKVVPVTGNETIDPALYEVRYLNGVYIIDFNDAGGTGAELKLGERLWLQFDLGPGSGSA